MVKIKSTNLSINRANFNKLDRLNLFLSDYKDAIEFYVNYLFTNKISYKINEKIIIFDIKNDQLNCPLFLSTKDIIFESNLSARALKCAITQACSIIRSLLKQRQKYLFVFNKLQSEKKRTRHITKLLKNNPITKPNLDNVFPELNSICCNYVNSDLKSFDNVIVLSSLGKKYGKIIIPVKHTKHSRKLEKQGELLKSFQISKNVISLRYQLNEIKQKTEGIIVGADQGINTCVTFSDGQITKECNHKHTLKSIINKVKKKKPGSKAFKKAKEHQKNYINWSINQLNLVNIKEIRLEKISNFRHKKNVGRFLNHFGETLIRSKLIDFAQQFGVQILEQNSAYRSQRCNQCGYVNRKNRVGKVFRCKHCSFQADADCNASCNHRDNLPNSDKMRFLLLLDKNKGFFWKEEGFFNLEGQELTVPDTYKKI